MITPKLALYLRLYRSILASREIDLLEQSYVQRGEAFFHVSGAGHENTAFLAPHLIPEDFLHCHYRDKALLLERGIPIKQFFLSLFCKDESHSRGRQMSAHLSDPARNVLSIVGPVGNNALQAVGIASIIKDHPHSPIVYCGMGDGTSQQGEVLEAIAHAARDHLPVMFVVQDNSFAISTRTRSRTFFSRPSGDAEEFYGLPIQRIDGRDPETAYEAFGRIAAEMRDNRGPALVVFQVERLSSHTNADNQEVYRSLEEIQAVQRTADPVRILEERLIAFGLPAEELAAVQREIHEQVLRAAEEAQDSPEPQMAYSAKPEICTALTDSAHEYRGDPAHASLTMIEALRGVLQTRLERDERVTIFGEDLEDPKGDVFGLTRGLSALFPGRVINSPLAEATIVGVSVGRALAGARPVCFLQFADFVPIAFNQICMELATMHWRTAGGWQAPVIVMVTCGGFKPGLGPFHASSMESFMAHVPGLDVFLPSTAGDAAGLLNAAFESARPTIFFYPKSCLNDRTQMTSSDLQRHLVPIGKGLLRRTGHSLTLVGWGNTVKMLEQTADLLAEHGAACDVIDLRSISPWDEELVLTSVRKTKKLIIAQEDNISASVASEIAASVAEKAETDVIIRRVARPDTFVPCNYANQLEVMPSLRRILETAVALLEGSVHWQKEESESGIFTVEARGSSPADESVTVLDWSVSTGDSVEKGMRLCEAEADKAVFEVSSPVSGVVSAQFVPAGETVKIGAPLMEIRTSNGHTRHKPATSEQPGVPIVSLPSASQLLAPVNTNGSRCNGNGSYSNGAGRTEKREAAGRMGVAAVTVRTGGRLVTNAEIAELCPSWDAEEIFRRFGIRNRFWVTREETAVTLATAAAEELLAAQRLTVADIDQILLTTGSPPDITPSLACLVLNRLSAGVPQPCHTAAVDISAACSGYLYGLQMANDFLCAKPEGRVLLITAEVLSKTLDTSDPATAPIFGDAATATLLLGPERKEPVRLRVERPVVGAKGETGAVLKVPRDPRMHLQMDGPKVFQEAVRKMLMYLELACGECGVRCSDLDLVIAHQANQRILNAVRQKAKLRDEVVYSAIADFGNTSSSSIPICLERLWANIEPGKVWGLCAFGGGFTFGGACVRTV